MDPYSCPTCGDKFELVVEKRVQEKYLDAKEITMTLTHDHELGRWRAFVREAGERKSEVSKDIEAKNREATKTARFKKAAEKRAEKPNRGFDYGLTEEERQVKIQQYKEKWSGTPTQY